MILQVFVNLRRGKGGIAPKVFPHLFVFVSLDDGLQQLFPAIRAVDVTGPQHRALAVPQLVETEKGMIAGATEVPVVGRSLLPAP